MTAPAPDVSDRALAKRLFRTYMAPRWPLLALATLCAAVVALASAGFAKLLEPAFNDVLIEADPESLRLIPLGIIGLAAVRALAQVGQARLVNAVGHRLVGRLQVELFGKLVRADLARLRSAHSGQYLSAVLYDSGLVREAATAGIINYVQHGLTVVALLAVMATQDPWLTLMVLVAAPLASFVMRRFAKRTRKAARGAMNETSALSTAVMESLDGVKIVKVENREAFEEGRVASVVERRQRHVIKGANARAAAAPVTEGLSALVIAAVIAYAGWRSSQGAINAGEFVAFLASLMLASQSLRQLANLQGVMSEGLTAAGRLFQALDIEPEVRDRPGARDLGRVRGEVRFEDVSFQYGEDAPALEGVTLQAEPGRTIALVGPSGGGKSTILNLIPRFYDVTGGRITVDGQDVRDVTLASLRSQIALVTQEPFLFDDTIANNIAYGRPDATRSEIEEAAHAAAAGDFIRRLNMEYDTVVGEAGARLSGGQRQRIAIARAFLKDAPILLLDEATSALDTESEAQVQEALDRLMAGRTTIMIAHRLSTVRNAHRLYVLDKGRIVEQGSHSELVAQGGLYARLARTQNLDVEPSEAARA
ncbi:MAG TPA: ABC transporter transmembrane domain-containing protein [Caulobacteraceae bacterium]|jgi:subfamily B ATP-binding cassette protein MsbA